MHKIFLLWKKSRSANEVIVIRKLCNARIWLRAKEALLSDVDAGDITIRLLCRLIWAEGASKLAIVEGFGAWSLRVSLWSLDKWLCTVGALCA